MGPVMSSPTERFSDRVDDYVRSRPSYPPAVLDLLREECGVRPGTVVADIGSGTGIFTELLLAAGCGVFAVEPNAGMRQAAENRLGAQAGFHSIDGSSDNTGLEPLSVDLVTAMQAFHWFDRESAKREFTRILRPGGWVAIVWNERLKTADAFQAGYERVVLRWGTDYAKVDHSLIGQAELNRFFAPQPCRFREFRNAQKLDWERLKSRLLSSSFAPNVHSPDCAPMLADLETLFREQAHEGHVTMRYRTVVYYGHLA
jgi:SAM-dependent methyltransferase